MKKKRFDLIFNAGFNFAIEVVLNTLESEKQIEYADQKERIEIIKSLKESIQEELGLMRTDG